MEKKYFFFDIDGTLTDGKGFHGGIPQSTKDAIRQLKENGHEVAIATGRPYVAAKDFAKEAGIENIVCNGGYTCYVHGEFILNKGMNLDDCHDLIRECIKKKIPFIVAERDDFVFHTNNDSFQNAILDDEFYAKIVVNQDIDFFSLPKIFRMMIALDEKDESKLNAFKTLVPSRYQKHHVMVEPDDKYSGVLEMIRALNGREEDVVVFGDGLNDVKMFENAPCSIAMGNGVARLKELANFVTKRSDEDGIAYALRYFGWLK